MADRIVVMNAGRVEQEGSAKDLYERPQTLFVASFLGSPPINLFDGQAANGEIRVREATLKLAGAASGDVVLGIRPESWHVSARGASARIVATEPLGREVMYSAESALGLLHFIEAGAEARHREGENVSLAFHPEGALLFDKASGRRLDARIAS